MSVSDNGLLVSYMEWHRPKRLKTLVNVVHTNIALGSNSGHLSVANLETESHRALTFFSWGGGVDDF